MKLKLSRIKEYIIYFLILCNLSIVKILPFFTESVVHWLTLSVTVVLFVAVIVRGKLSRYYKNLTLVFFFFIIAEYFYSIVILGTELSDCIQYTYFFFYLLLAPVIFETLKKDEKWFYPLCKFIILFVAISAVMRIAVSVYHGMTGSYLFGDIAFEFASEGWARNAVRRINMPSMTVLFVPLTIWLIINDKIKRRKKIILLLFLFIVEYFIFNVYMARSVMAYTIIASVFMILIKKKSSRKQLFLFALISIAFVILVNTEFFTSYIQSFSLSSDLGLSSLARISALGFYFKSFLNNPIFGIGILTQDVMNVGLSGGDISDIGIVGFVFHFGLIGLLLLLFIIIRWVKVVKFLSIAKAEQDRVLVLGIILITLLTGINIDCFYAGIIFSLPFASAIIEYLLYRNKEKVLVRNDGKRI